MSYIQIEIGGKPRGLKFNQMAAMEMLKYIKEDNLMSNVYALVYTGLEANCYVKNENIDFTFEQVTDWVDGLSEDNAIKIRAAYEESQSYKKGQAYLADLEAAKKKDLPEDKPTKNIKQTASKSP